MFPLSLYSICACLHGLDVTTRVTNNVIYPETREGEKYVNREKEKGAERGWGMGIEEFDYTPKNTDVCTIHSHTHTHNSWYTGGLERRRMFADGRGKDRRMDQTSSFVKTKR